MRQCKEHPLKNATAGPGGSESALEKRECYYGDDYGCSGGYCWKQCNTPGSGQNEAFYQNVYEFPRTDNGMNPFILYRAEFNPQDPNLIDGRGNQYALGGAGGASLGTVLALMAGFHLFIGIGEGVITATTVGAVASVRPDLVHLLRTAAPPARAATERTPS